jgi:hypothetical protein
MISQIVGPECVPQQLTHREDAGRGIDQTLAAPMLPDQLATAAAWHQNEPVAIDAGNCEQPTTATGKQCRDQPTFRA